MTDLYAINEDVRFAWSAAERLAAQLRAAASTCENQVPHRNAIARQAQQEWRGVYAGQFETRTGICTADARRLAEALRRAASQVDELGRLARQEQERREKARQWQRAQDSEGVLEEIKEFFTGDDDKPPVPDPVTPPVYTVTAPVSANRG